MLHSSLLTYYDGLEYILFTENVLLKLNIKINKKRNIFINLSQNRRRNCNDGTLKLIQSTKYL